MEATAEAVMVVYSSYSLQALEEIKIWSTEKTNTVEAEVTDDNTPVVAVVEAIARLSAEKAECRGFGYCFEEEKISMENSDEPDKGGSKDEIHTEIDDGWV